MIYIKYWLIIVSGEGQEIQEIKDVILNLSRRLENLTKKNNKEPSNVRNKSNDDRSFSPVLIKEKERDLPPMSSSYRKTLHVNIHLY